jgi:hypothetical protein
MDAGGCPSIDEPPLALLDQPKRPLPFAPDAVLSHEGSKEDTRCMAADRGLSADGVVVTRTRARQRELGEKRQAYR